MQRVGDEGGICVVAESCHQTSGGIGLMASFKHVSSGKRFIKSEIRKIYLPVIQRAA